MRRTFVQRRLVAVASVSAVAASGCGSSVTLPAPPAAPPVHVALRDSPPEVELFPASSYHSHYRRGYTVDPPLLCTTSPCDALAPAGSELRAGGPFPISRPILLPPSGNVRIVVRPGSVTGSTFSTLAGVMGLTGVLVGGAFLSSGIVHGCDCADHGRAEIIGGSITVAAGLAVAVLGVWGFHRSRTEVTVEPVLRF